MSPMRKIIALTWQARQEELGYKGKAADRACLEFWLGAWTVLDAIKHPEAGNIANIAGFLIATRGARYNAELANTADNAPLADEAPAPNEDRLGFGIEHETDH